jgi:hypothetical protein
LGPPGQVDRPAHAAMDSSVDTAPALDAAVDLEHGLITPGPVVCLRREVLPTDLVGQVPAPIR